MRCPFHDDAEPSCKIYPDHWFCYGCGERGNRLDWLMRVEGMTEAEAISFIKDWPGTPAPVIPKRQCRNPEAQGAGCLARFCLCNAVLEPSQPFRPLCLCPKNSVSRQRRPGFEETRFAAAVGGTGAALSTQADIVSVDRIHKGDRLPLVPKRTGCLARFCLCNGVFEPSQPISAALSLPSKFRFPATETSV